MTAARLARWLQETVQEQWFVTRVGVFRVLDNHAEVDLELQDGTKLRIKIDDVTELFKEG